MESESLNSYQFPPLLISQMLLFFLLFGKVCVDILLYIFFYNFKLTSTFSLRLLHKNTKETLMADSAVVSPLKANVDVSADVFRYTVLSKLPPGEEELWDSATTLWCVVPPARRTGVVTWEREQQSTQTFTNTPAYTHTNMCTCAHTHTGLCSSV